MILGRRQFLGTLALGGAALALPAGSAFGVQPAGRRLLVVLLRGAADGLSMVVPYREARYGRLRPDLAIAGPGRGAGRAVDLDGSFGLHPVLEPLAKHYRDGRLAVVVATGSPSLTRSHFDAQDFLETGTPDERSTADGWLNRYLQARPGEEGATLRAVALSGPLRDLRNAFADVPFRVDGTGATALGLAEGLSEVIKDTLTGLEGAQQAELDELEEEIERRQYAPRTAQAMRKRVTDRQKREDHFASSGSRAFKSCASRARSRSNRV